MSGRGDRRVDGIDDGKQDTGYTLQRGEGSGPRVEEVYKFV